ncbi:hypothetical protein PPL_03968 [Heterostelium album PN500]|uniref:Uncharacterized protein n=1 Tax=Heterostelium pallidum (strain ATCC 26659 / Pp 5 / PN500) TaxID=670386 RepID=D3B5N0_HETP5|nr:hypothetical protein PPL_03968 [Heterostelium album PN500]EFA83178.1 hypothetical protein PPL_03968 [Heterostelium album PN500]|eukprot:XP_020435295.1 hypothetical protein PPL_03968 [Heterostelium album PN500]
MSKWKISSYTDSESLLASNIDFEEITRLSLSMSKLQKNVLAPSIPPILFHRRKIRTNLQLVALILNVPIGQIKEQVQINYQFSISKNYVAHVMNYVADPFPVWK